ncbi:MAG: LuxR C-terminal-related transcriptional regulator [Dyadobacter sp.]
MKFTDAMHALIAGADGFIHQLAEIEEILLAVTNLMMGKRYWGRQLLRDMAIQLLLGQEKDKIYSELTQAHRLSKPETDVLRALILGESVPTVAFNSGISSSTIATHKSIVFKKLGISNVDQLMETFPFGKRLFKSKG